MPRQDIRWVVAPPDPRRAEWADRLRISPITAQVLLNRGLTDLQQARRWLRPEWSDLHDPDLLPDIDKAVERLARAVAAGEKIVVFGDYDVDGITGTSLTWHGLKLAGANVDYYGPHRIEEGYGLNVEAVRRLAESGVKVIVSVDCGISAVEPARVAAEAGVDLLITDHHEPPDVLPQAPAVVNPKVPGSKYPDPNLCGAGVAFKVAWALGRRLSGDRKVTPAFREFLLSAGGLAALATIADVVPLQNENRVLASRGLRGLPHVKNVGVQALLRSAGVADKVDDYDAAYILGPRLNAAGRMGHAALAVELFTTASEARAAEIAEYLEAQNDLRRKVEQRILIHAREKIKLGRCDPQRDRAIVLADEEWHAGVIGICAGRLVEEFRRPTILLAIREGVASGSARSVEGFNLHEALMICKEHTLSCGGHAMAGGMRLKAENIPAFTAAFTDHCRANVTDEQMQAKLRIDSEVILPALTEGLVKEFDLLAPFGNSNPRPTLTAAGVMVMGDARVMKDAHLSFTVNQGGRGFRCVFWRNAERAAEIGHGVRLSIAFTPKINEFNNRRNVELEIKDMKIQE